MKLGGRIKIVIDTSAWIEYFRATNSVSDKSVAKVIEEAEIVVPDLIYLEVMRGFTKPDKAHVVDNLLSQLTSVEICSSAAVRVALMNNSELRAIGKTVRKSVDLLVGTWCIENRVYLLHQDRDYEGMEEHLGLKVWRGD